jgi:hypothetical protein
MLGLFLKTQFKKGGYSNVRHFSEKIISTAGMEVVVWQAPKTEVVVWKAPKAKQKKQQTAVVMLDKEFLETQAQLKKLQVIIQKSQEKELLRSEIEKLNREARRLQLQKQAPTTLAVIDYKGKKISLVSLVQCVFDESLVLGSLDGIFFGPGTDLIYLKPGTKGYCGTSMEGESFYNIDGGYFDERLLEISRTDAAHSLAVEGFWILVQGFGSFGEEGTFERRQYARANALSEAVAICRTLKDVDAGKILKGLEQELYKLAAAGDLKGVNSWLSNMEKVLNGIDDPWRYRAMVEAVALVSAQALQLMDEKSPLLEVNGFVGGEALLNEMYSRYDQVKKEESPSAKTGFLDWLSKNVMPKLIDPLTIQQMLGMVIAYIDLPEGAELTVYPLGVARVYTLRKKVVQRTRLEDYSQFKEKGLPGYGSVSVQIWEGQDVAGNAVVVSVFRGTASISAQDSSAQKEKHTTGATANGDESGVGHTGFVNKRGEYAQAVLTVDPRKKKRHYVIGHSLGGATSFDGFACLTMHGFKARYVGFNAPGTNHSTFGMLSRFLTPEKLASLVTLVTDGKDWIPTAGNLTPFGRVIRNWTKYTGRSGLLPIKFDDWVLGHGSINLIIRALVGARYREEVWHAANSTISIIEHLRPSFAYFIFGRNQWEKRWAPPQFQAWWKAVNWTPAIQIEKDQTEGFKEDKF